MIAPDAKPIANRNPYKRVDLAAKRRKTVITREDVENGEPVPDPDLYEWWLGDMVWRLKK